MSGVLKKFQAAQEKRSASCRMTNVVCSTAVFPDEFEVDPSPMSKKSNGSAHMFPSSSSPPNNSRREMSPTDSCRSDESFSEDLSQQMLAPQLTQVENQFLVQQVQWNVELMKLRLFDLLEVAVVPFEQEELRVRTQDLLEKLGQYEGTLPSNQPSRPPSASRKVASHGSCSSKLAVQTSFALDGVFRFAFEEISLRWHALQSRPFSLRAYHQVAKEQIRLRDVAIESKEKESTRTSLLEKENGELRFKLEHDAHNHNESLKVLLTENRVLRQRIMDLQLKLKIDEPIPQLFDTRAAVQATVQSEDSQVPSDPNEKHYEVLNRRLTEECMLLSHTLEQRNGVVKVLHAELSVAKTQAADVKENFRRYVHEQEALDVEFRKTFAQNELTTAAAKQECEVATNRAEEIEHQLAHLSGEVEGLESKISTLETDRTAAVAERDHLRHRNNDLVCEAERAKEELGEALERAAQCAAQSALEIQAAHRRIHELENDGTREKLENALMEVRTLQDRVKVLQRAVESRDHQLEVMRSEHKSEVDKLEEQISKAKDELEATKVKFEDLMMRERQKGAELAEKKVAEANSKFEKEREMFRAQIFHIDRTLKDLTLEVMLFHRQSTLLESFLRRHLGKDRLRELGKLLLKRDLRNTVAEQGGESDCDIKHASSHVGDGVHTPRTRLYFGRHHVLEPEEIQCRLTIATEQQDINRSSDEPHIPRLDSSGAPSALLLKSKITEDFLCAISDGVPPDGLTKLPTAEGSSHENSIPAGTELDPNTNRTIQSPENHMVVHEFKSALVKANLEIKALQDELFAIQEGSLVNSAAIQTSFASAQSISGSPRRIKSAGRSRPSSAFTHRSDETPGCESPVLLSGVAPSLNPAASLGSIVGSTMIQRGQSGLPKQPNGCIESKHEDLRSLTPEFHSMHARATSGCIGAEMAPLQMAREFPGLQHASEFIDLFESFYSLRHQLSSLVQVCVAEAERGCLHPNDLPAAQELLHSKFTIFRAVESENNAMLHRLRHKKEDLMRHREEELERVLAAMQNIAITHPKESASLLRVSKSASRSRQLRSMSGGPLPLKALQCRNLNEQISAVVVRPVSQQSERRLTPIPADVAVSGAPALMSLRKRATSASQHRSSRER